MKLRTDPAQNRWYTVNVYGNGEKNIKDSTMKPTESANTDWLHASSDEWINDIRVDTSNAGKWLVFIDKDKIEDVWKKIKDEIKSGKLWSAKTILSNDVNANDTYVLLVDVHDINSDDALIQTYEVLLKAKIINETDVIKFKSDKQTANREYGVQAYLFTSDDIKIKIRDRFKNELTGRAKERVAEKDTEGSEYNSKMGWLFGMSSKRKVDSIDKVISALDNPNQKIEFDAKELIALQTGLLGTIMSKYAHVWPQQYKDASIIGSLKFNK